MNRAVLEDWLQSTDEAWLAAAALGAGFLYADRVFGESIDALDRIARLLAPELPVVGPPKPPLSRWQNPDDEFLARIDGARIGGAVITLLSRMSALANRSPALRVHAIATPATTAPDDLAWFRGLIPELASRTSVTISFSQARPVAPVTPAPPWRWPLRLAWSPSIYEELHVPGWWADLVVPVDLGAPWSSPSLAVVLAGDPQVRAAAVAVLGDDVPDTLLAEMATKAGVVVAPGAVDPMPWLSSLVAELAHDMTLDEAVQRTAPDLPTARILADPALLEQTSVRSQVRVALARAHDAERSGVAADGTPFELATLENGPFDHESHDATIAARSIGDVERRLVDHEQRWLTGRISDPDGQMTVSLDPLTAYVLEVCISPDIAVDAGDLRADVPFPGDKVPTLLEGLELDLVFARLQDGAVAQRAPVTLPPVGTSTSAAFALTTGERGERYSARLTVLFQGRFVQTALVRGVVGDGAPVRLTVESVVRPLTADLLDLAEGPPPEMAIVLNHDGDDPIVNVFADGEVLIRKPDGLEDVTRQLGDLLGQVVDDPDRYRVIEDPPFQALLVGLAEHGRVLHQALFGPVTGVVRAADTQRLTGDSGSISVLWAPSYALLPLEFVYDLALSTGPGQPGTVCGHARQALDDGVCPVACRDRAPSTVCPLGFWGLRKVIERLADKDAADRLHGTPYEYAISPGPTAARHRVTLGKVLAGASEKANDNTETAWTAACTDLVALLGSDVRFAGSWTDWAAKVQAELPQVLLILAHTERHVDDTYFEIGGASDLKFGHDFAPLLAGSIDGSFALMLGCSTAPGVSPLVELPGKLLNEGAKVVLGTLTLMRARHAAPLGVVLIRALHDLTDSQPGGVPFGEAVRYVRRTCLPTNPMVFALAAYGDAGWLVVPR